jgi:hypothetical protein
MLCTIWTVLLAALKGDYARLPREHRSPKMPDLLDVVTLALGVSAVLIACSLWAELLSSGHLRPK